MELFKQVCTLQQAKRLRALGIVQGKSAFAYIRNSCRSERFLTLRCVQTEGVSYEGYDNHHKGCLLGYSAFTVSELGQALPHDCMSLRNSDQESDTIKWNCDWQSNLESEWLDTEAEARADLLILLLETGSLTAEEANKRLQA